ncbi:MAG: NAD(P)H-hydrate dehydratase [Lachnospiraceae bacterium]|nr:NAD(P)H-hydrate dehydratase [Lachnospiraceae bacterium]
MKEYLLSKEEMALYDRNTTEKLGISKEVLIERAALAVVEYICDEFTVDNKRILVAAGFGNNGADGFAIARILKEFGFYVEIFSPVQFHEYRADAAKQVYLCRRYMIDIHEELPNDNYDIYIDALFGIGLNRDIDDRFAGIINALNRKRGYKISVDIPSGIDSNTGEVLGTAFMADTTVTFGFYKRGLFLNKGPEYAGTIVKKYVGINQYSFDDKMPDMFMYLRSADKIDVGRNNFGNKGTFGKVLIIAGREDMSGACVLAAKSALRSGCGMVSVITEDANKAILLAALPEVIIHTYRSEDDIDAIFEEAEHWCDVVAIGPGIGTDRIAIELLKRCILKSNKPLCIDADAINIIARNRMLKATLLDKQGNADTFRPVIMTPHIKEFARISGKTVPEVIADGTSLAKMIAKQFRAVVVLKDAYSLVVGEDKIYINVYANDAMATAGSGDVLLGLLASFMSQYIHNSSIMEAPEADHSQYPFYAAAMTVYVHSLAGLKASEMNGRSYMIASDIVEKYGEILV